MNLSMLPTLLELAIVIHGVGAFARSGTRLSNFSIAASSLIFATLGSVALSIGFGGTVVGPMALKVLFFAVMLALAIHRPLAARPWLIIAIVCELIAQASMGNVLDKLSAIPFLLMASIWATGRKRFGRAEWQVIVAALVAELSQALLVESRGFLITVTVATIVLLCPIAAVRRVVRLTAALLPIVYPLSLSLVLVSFLAGSDLFDPTISNFERSALAAWCLTHLHEFVATGPGTQQYFDSTNEVLSFMQRAREELLDPHTFLLSAWIWLGSASTLLLYIGWCWTWFTGPTRGLRPYDRRLRVFAILGVLAIFPFTLSPPDTSRRILVAMTAGIAIAGLRNPAVLHVRAHTHRGQPRQIPNYRATNFVQLSSDPDRHAV